MGLYINKTSKRNLNASAEDKCNGILEDGGIEITQPLSFMPYLVCVVDNFYFGAAAYCYSENEFNAFTYHSDKRPKRWFIYNNAEIYAE